MKTILLMRHSIPEICNLPNEEIPLSVNGIGLIMNKKSSLDINQAFTSPFKRSYQTANLIHENPVIINSLKERIVGQPENDFWTKQYNDYNYKNTDGESLNEVKLRMLNAMEIVLNNTQDNETSLVVSHATAICSYLLNYCKIEVLDTSKKTRKIIFNNNEIFNGFFNYASYFEIIFENNEIVSIQHKSI